MKKIPLPSSRKNSPKGTATIGPVPDLERHLSPDWWKHLFNSIYIKTDADVVESNTITSEEVDQIEALCQLDKNARILDLCCGQGRHVLELARRGYSDVTGVDRSRYLTRLAKKRAAKEGLTVHIHEGDARKYRPRGEPFDCVLSLGNSFGYFDLPSDDETVIGTIKRALKPGGTLYFDIANGDWLRKHFQKRSWEWIDQVHFVCRERMLSTNKEKLISREVVVHSEKGVIADQFYAERLYTFEDIQRLLKKFDFSDIELNATMETDSERGQDLGMMAQRLIITANAPGTSSPKAATTGRRKGEVTVLLGDPKLPDSVKLEGHFNEADLDTVEKLKSALGELKDYHFLYLNNHATLFADLAQVQSEFVLNLCDEGFDNDAFKELHVPAMLEILNIPYTGAGPACLGQCYDKALVRAIAQSLDIPVPLETYFNPDDLAANLPGVFPALIKPNQGDSSIGITKDAVVNGMEELIEYVSTLRDTLGHRSVLVQEYLDGPEYTVGLIGNPGQEFRMLPLLEVDYSNLDADLPRILGYESKWDPASPYWTKIAYKEATLEDEKCRLLQDYSMLLFERLGCRDYARFDFRTDGEGVIKLLEVNPNPGWCWDGKFNLMAGFAGCSYADLLNMILHAARARIALTSH